MTRRLARKLCALCGKRCYRDRAAAEWGANEVAAAITRARGRVDMLYAYPAHGGLCWHLTREAIWYGAPGDSRANHDPIDLSRGIAKGEAARNRPRPKPPRGITE